MTQEISNARSPQGLGRLGRETSLGRFAERVLKSYVLVLFLLLLIVVFSFLSSTFMTGQNWSSMLSLHVIDACVALAIVLPLVAGDFDLSAGYVIGLLTMLGAYLGGHGADAGLAILAMVAGGLLVGALNGTLTVPLGINSFISTLGTGLLLSGVTLGLSGGAVLYTGIPQSLVDFAQGKFLGVSPGVFVVLALAIILLFVLEHTPLGSKLYATGASEEVARLSGIRTKRLKFGAFVVSGLIIAIGAVLELGQAGTASPTFGPQLLLPAYAAAFLGATCHRPGRFNIVGTIVAVLLLSVGFNGLSLIGVPAWVEPVFNGVILLIAVLLSRRQARTIQVG